MCYKFYTTRYKKQHQQTLKHIENEFEYNVQNDIDQQLEDYFNYIILYYYQ